MNRTIQVLLGAILLVAGAALLYAEGLWLDETGTDGSDPVRLSLWLWPLTGMVVTVTGLLRSKAPRAHGVGARRVRGIRAGCPDETGLAGAPRANNDDQPEHDQHYR